MQFFRLCLLFRWVPMLAFSGLLSGCAPITERTFTFEPDRTASIFGDKSVDTFGVCDPFTVDRRGTRLYVWDEFVRQRGEPRYDIRDLAGYEVSVSRGESCHLRIADTFQAAARFDLTELPEGAAIVSAELRIDRSFSPLDPPYLRGSEEQCNVIVVGQADAPWSGGVFEAGSPAGPRPFIAWRPARPGAGPHDGRGAGVLSVNVTNAVSEWVRDARPNNGFVITPDLDRVMEFYEATDEGGYMCDVGITGFELVVTAAVRDE